MKVLECELENLDTFDPDVLEKIENAKDRVLEECEQSEKEEKRSVSIRRQCAAVAEFIETLWGKGTAKKVFSEKTNLLQCLKAFEDIMIGLGEDTNRQTEEVHDMIKKYSPNRAARRSKEK